MEKTDKPLTRDALVSMQVIDAKGKLLGKVKDVVFAVGKMGIALTVENDDGEQTVAWEEVQAASDFIILKPCTNSLPTATVKALSTSTNPNCSSASSATVDAAALSNMQNLNLIPQYQRWYCITTKMYKNIFTFFLFLLLTKNKNINEN
jgi:sporulation protein YlmC with PRC-barrel domain